MHIARPLLVLAFLLTACGTGAIPGDVAMPNGSRQWIINVDNQSGEDARLIVALGNVEIGEQVGNATPAVVAPRTKRDVVFAVPPGDEWAIFLTTAQRGAMLTANDVPLDVAGKLPISLVIDVNGDSFIELPGALPPGWLGN